MGATKSNSASLGETMGENVHTHHKTDEAAIEAALKNMTSKSDSGISDVDAVAGASLGVEGIIELGRKALEKQKISGSSSL